MTTPEPEDDLSDEEAARRRDEIVRRMIATPPKPRTGKRDSADNGREPKPAPKRS
jgi:hypothetical protein